MEKLNVAIADDNEKMVEILGKMIDEDKELELVGKAHNGENIHHLSLYLQWDRSGLPRMHSTSVQIITC